MARYTERLNLVVTPEQLRFIDRIAGQSGVSRSEVVRSLIDGEMSSSTAPALSIEVKLDRAERRMLWEVAQATGSFTTEEVFKTLLKTFHVLMASGVLDVLKPLPELAELAVKRAGRE